MATDDTAQLSDMEIALRNAARDPAGQVFPWLPIYPLAGQAVIVCGSLGHVIGKRSGDTDCESDSMVTVVVGDTAYDVRRTLLRPVTWTDAHEARDREAN